MTDSDSETFLPHGLDNDKIMGLTSIIRVDNNVGHTPGHGNPGDSIYYYLFYNGPNIYLSDVGSYLQNNPYKVIVWYED